MLWYIEGMQPQVLSRHATQGGLFVSYMEFLFWRSSKYKLSVSRTLVLCSFLYVPVCVNI